MMNFTQPAFVRVENPAERKELTVFMELIGRKTITAHNGDEDCIYLIAHNRPDTMWMALMGDSTKSRFEKEFHNCGSNIELFKALAAMNDENDLWQYHVCLTDHWNDVAVGELILKRGEDDERIFWEPLFRKATAEEIIKHFKNRQQ